MIKRQDGFSLIELLVAMVVFVMVITAATTVFMPLITTHKQQSKITETNIEGIVGLDILRRDIEHAGYGLPWALGGISYEEAVNDTVTDQDEQWYNDATTNAPRALVSGDGDGDGIRGDPGSDVLVIKSLIVAINNASQKWTHVNKKNIVSEWDPDKERLETSDRVIVVAPGKVRTLINDGSGGFTTRYDEDGANPDKLVDAEFLPADAEKNYVVYGVTPPASPVTASLRMPFNRADYYITKDVDADGNDDVPARCALGTGVLVKNILQHDNNGFLNAGLPLIDCVADMQVTYGVDNDNDGDFEPGPTPDNYFADFSGTLTTAKQVRRVKQVRVSILAHEGQKDPNFTFNNFTCTGNCITVGDIGGRDFKFNTEIGSAATTYWDNYRWKVYTLVVKVEG